MASFSHYIELDTACNWLNYFVSIRIDSKLFYNSDRLTDSKLGIKTTS